MNKKAILGPASGASEHNVAKPSGLGCRVDGTFARGKLVFLSGEISFSCVWSLITRSCVGNSTGEIEKSAEGIVVV